MRTSREPDIRILALFCLNTQLYVADLASRKWRQLYEQSKDWNLCFQRQKITRLGLKRWVKVFRRSEFNCPYYPLQSIEHHLWPLPFSLSAPRTFALQQCFRYEDTIWVHQRYSRTLDRISTRCLSHKYWLDLVAAISWDSY